MFGDRAGHLQVPGVDVTGAVHGERCLPRLTVQIDIAGTIDFHFQRLDVEGRRRDVGGTIGSHFQIVAADTGEIQVTGAVS